MSCVVGVWLVELPSSSIMYWKVPRLIVKKTNRLTQAVVFFEGIFCAERCCVIIHRQSVRSIYTCTTGMSAEPFMRSILSQRILTSLPGSRLRFFYRDANSVPTSTPFYSIINRLYAQNPVFEIVREESVKVYLHMHNGNVQQNPPCVESCVTKEISISPQLSPTMFDPDANSVLLRAHLCTAVDSMCRKACVRNCSRERKGLFNGNVILTTHLCTAALYAEPCARSCS